MVTSSVCSDYNGSKGVSHVMLCKDGKSAHHKEGWSGGLVQQTQDLKHGGGVCVPCETKSQF